ncbi:MAG: hypothetical protein JWM82_3714 [Myxococcales bacterium]|nr:hypothetical protein [Myxococcales bacterium]
MNPRMNLRALSLALSLGVSVAGGASARAETVVPAKDPADALMKSLLDALKANDYAGFVAEGTAKHTASGKAAFARLGARFGPLLMKGYKTTVLQKPDASIHRWKLEPAGSTQPFEIELVTKDGKVDAFSIR